MQDRCHLFLKVFSRAQEEKQGIFEFWHHEQVLTAEALELGLTSLQLQPQKSNAVGLG